MKYIYLRNHSMILVRSSKVAPRHEPVTIALRLDLVGAFGLSPVIGATLAGAGIRHLLTILLEI